MPNSKKKENWTAAKLRHLWIDFFQKKQHTLVASSSLFPAEDPTLLFTSAGMVPFKSYFAGLSAAPWPRAVSIQKCLRTTDLDSVGKSERHCSFFEMLGNFSFGDYFKKEAIQYAWEFSIQCLGFPAEKIYVTVYKDDNESERLWTQEIGVPLERIKRLGVEDNWWGPVGNQGPCGPCSELYLDRGAHICESCHCQDKKNCAPGGEGERFMEYWNLVFNEFYRDANGQDKPLPAKGVDTGAGLERILALLENQESIYETDEMRRIIEYMASVLACEAREDKQKLNYNQADATTKTALRVLGDHARAVSFSLADGIYPSNTGRGYVVRRIIRHALLYARDLEIYKPFLYRLVEPIVEIYAPHYPELGERKSDLEERIRKEEERFLETLELGLGKWQEFLQEHAQQKKKVFSGQAAFLLYDTYGFPLECTLELAAKAGLSVDQRAFEKEMNAQRERSTAVTEMAMGANTKLPALQISASRFQGYTQNSLVAQVVAIIQEGKLLSNCQAGEATLAIILDETSFYPEGGGQLGDTGTLRTASNAVFSVRDTQKQGDFILHIGGVEEGVLSQGEKVTAAIHTQRRDALRQHHSATHLLNHALRKTLGEHVTQTGSLVAPDHLRFDFTHTSKVSQQDLRALDAHVNQAIAAAVSVSAEVMPIAQARKLGAVATFGEKYSEEVRVLRMGKQGEHSLEFCGGCHVANTADIEFFHITKETSPGSGNRRIEAFAGQQVLSYFEREWEQLRQEIRAHNQELGALIAKEPSSSKLVAQLDSLSIKIKADFSFAKKDVAKSKQKKEVLVALWAQTLQESKNELGEVTKKKYKLLKKANASKKQDNLQQRIEESLQATQTIGSWSLVCQEFDNLEMATIRQLADQIKAKSRRVVILFGVRQGKGAQLLFSADKPAVAAGLNMRDLIASVSSHINGGGGGRPDMAQAGGKDHKGLSACLQAAKEMVIKTIGE